MDISLFLILPHFYLTKFLSFAKFLSKRTTNNSFLSQSLCLSLFGLLVLKQYHFLTCLLWQTLLLAAENVARLLHTSKEENQIVSSQRSVIFLKYFHTWKFHRKSLKLNILLHLTQNHCSTRKLKTKPSKQMKLDFDCSIPPKKKREKLYRVPRTLEFNFLFW